jgi:uncharacterized heparinase superfamily protein
LIVHPDGELPFFNDTTLGLSPSFDELRGYAARIGIEHTPGEPGATEMLEASCFVRSTSPDGRTFVLLDVGGPSPAYQPGHAHSEALSIELSRDGRRLVVNAGVSTYERSEERLSQRRTASHSTLRIDGEEQSELWASHRCGRRCRCARGTTDGAPWGEHYGYSRLPGRPVHRRTLLVADGDVTIEDRLTGAGTHLVERFLHLHPDAAARLDGSAVAIELKGEAAGRIVFDEESDVCIEAGSWHPGFNLSIENVRVVVRSVVALPATLRTSFRWI